MTVRRFSTHSDFEQSFGFARAVRASNLVFVAGCTAMATDGAATDDVKGQTREALRRVVEAIEALADSYVVVRTRFFVTNCDDWQDVGEVHREFFGLRLPASTLVEVSALAHESLRVEVEADAVVVDE